MEKKILDVTCGNRSIWFNKNHPLAIYCDKRDGVWEKNYESQPRVYEVKPDVVCDFTDLPFEDNRFKLVVFDPPHLKNIGENSWFALRYGRLDDGWEQMLRDGFKECMRVLEPNGILIFKWSERDISASDVWKAIGEKPLFGHHSGKQSYTFWACFMKLEEEEK